MTDTRERAKLDFSVFEPETKTDSPDVDALKEMSEESGFASRTPAPVKPSAGSNKRRQRRRRKRTKRTAQLNIKCREETYNRFIDFEESLEFEQHEDALLALFEKAGV